MEEAKRFLRFVMPGMAFLVQLFVLHIIYDSPNKFIGRNFGEVSEIGIALSALLVAGVIGYIASNLYYLLHWKFYFCRFAKINYKGIVEETTTPLERNKFKFDLQNSKQRDAWAFMNVYWNVYGDKKYPAVQGASGRIANVLHSIGTTTVLTFVGLLIGTIVLCGNGDDFLCFTCVNAAIVFILMWNYQILAGILHRIYVNAYRSITVVTGG